MLKVQEYLREGPGLHGLDDLKQFGIYFNRHPEFPNLVQLTYDMIEASGPLKTNPMVMECRGLILDAEDNWNIIAFPFTRFFNDGEEAAAKIDWSTARVQEKVDGTLIIMYHYGNRWRVATRGSADAGGPVGAFTKAGTDKPWTFQDLFWSSCEYWLKGLCKSGGLIQGYTYMFELWTPLNKVVCDYRKTGMTQWKCEATGEVTEMEDDVTGYGHDGSRITLIGVRNNASRVELPVRLYSNDFHYTVKEFPLTSWDAVIAAAAELDPLHQEGFVVVDVNFNRIKIKSPKYVLLHHLRDGFGPRRLIDLIKLGEEGEFLTYFPEFADQFAEYKLKYDNLVLYMENAWQGVNLTVGGDLATQKEFALEAVKTRVPGYLFARRKGLSPSAKEYLKNMAADKLLELI